MKKTNINEAKQEAKHFLAKIEDFELWLKAKRKLFVVDNISIGGNKTTSALKRASMDLTRALAQMRKSEK
jgi:hypothetical protein